MAATKHPKEKLLLPWSVLLIALLPLAVVTAFDWILDTQAAPNPFFPGEVKSHFDGHAEAAGRIHVLASFVLFVAGAVVSIAYFLWTLWRLPSRARNRLTIGYAIAIALGALIVVVMDTRQTQSYVDPGAVCVALSEPSAGNRLPRFVPVDRSEGTSKNDVRGAGSGQCAAEHFRDMRLLISIELVLLVSAVAALAFGSIACLTLPPVGSNRRYLHRVVEIQAERLNRYLYLSAALLVVGLFFVSAFLRWPAFIFKEPASFNAHVDALLLYFGVSYSIVIASYYVPVALLLSRAARRAGGVTAPAELNQNALVEPLRAAKVSLAIFAPTLAGIASSLLDLGS